MLPSFVEKQSKSCWVKEAHTMAKLQITLVRSLIGRNEKQRATVESLGLRKIRQSVVLNDNPAIRGMVNHVSHLVKVEEV
ncbi:50S ribosomal protein L30 [Paenibacillus sp. GSMTC-2017]|nr:50S ribosomal protein L30 [Paenibacillus sp. GSMTC-2017]